MIKYFYKNLKLKKAFIAYIFLNIIINITGLIIPIFFAEYLDKLIKLKTINTLVELSIMFISITVLEIIISFIIMKLDIELQTNTKLNMLENITLRLHNIPIKYYTHNSTTSIIQAVNTDIDKITKFSFNFFISMTLNSISLVFSILYLSKIEMKLLLTSIIFSIINFIIYNTNKTKLYESNKTLIENQNIFFESSIDSLKDIRTIKINNLSKNKIDNLTTSFFYLKSSLKIKSLLEFNLRTLNTLLKIVSTVYLYITCGILFIKGNITIGTFTVISTYFNKVFMSLNYFSDIYKDYKVNQTHFDRLSKIIKEDLEIYGTEELLDRINNITIKNLSFSYKDNFVLKNFNMKISPGITLIKGENGSGKSTLVDLIIGLYPNDYKGKILYNNMEISDLNIYAFRENKISYCQQKSRIDKFFIDEILKNSTNKEKQVFHINYDKLCNLQTNNEIINRSGGEVQKILINKVFLRDTDIIILDEPTSYLDLDGVKKLVSYLKRIRYEKIIIIVSHENLFDDISDQIINLKKLTSRSNNAIH